MTELEEKVEHLLMRGAVQDQLIILLFEVLRDHGILTRAEIEEGIEATDCALGESPPDVTPVDLRRLVAEEVSALLSQLFPAMPPARGRDRP